MLNVFEAMNAFFLLRGENNFEEVLNLFPESEKISKNPSLRVIRLTVFATAATCTDQGDLEDTVALKMTFTD